MPKRKTKEEYVEELKIKNPTIELVGDYINAKTKTLHHCITHDVWWDAAPDHIIHGRGCKLCGIEKYSNKRKKTREQYIEELKIKNPTLILTGKYIDTHTPTQHCCTTHDVLFDIRPYDAVRGSGCKYCGYNKMSIIKTKSEEQYIKDLEVKNPNVQLIGKYSGANTPTQHRCLIHDIVWNITPANALSGNGCKYCKIEKISNKNRKQEDKYISELLNKNPDIKLSGMYINEKTPTEHYCIKHDMFFDISPMVALRGGGCRQCGSEKIRTALLKTKDEYMNELKSTKPNIILLGDYIGANIKTLHKCLVCGTEWEACPNNILHGGGCSVCAQSKGERDVKLWLDKNNFVYTPQKKFENCYDKRLLSFDFYLDNYNICIEYQGIQHYEPRDYFGGETSFLYTQSHDKIKSNYCKDNNIRLICIPYWEDVNNYLDKNLLV